MAFDVIDCNVEHKFLPSSVYRISSLHFNLELYKQILYYIQNQLKF